jgi:putative transcriptional regulator
MDEPNSYLGNHIRAARTAKKLTQEVLAERLGVSSETISHFERGVTTPSLKTLLTLAKLIELDLPAIFAGLPGKPRKVSTDRADLEAKLRLAMLTWDDASLRLLADLADVVERNTAKAGKPAKG